VAGGHKSGTFLPATVAILPLCLRNRHPIAARAIVM
jgi:hypothetical protein